MELRKYKYLNDAFLKIKIKKNKIIYKKAFYYFQNINDFFKNESDFNKEACFTIARFLYKTKKIDFTTLKKQEDAFLKSFNYITPIFGKRVYLREFGYYDLFSFFSFMKKRSFHKYMGTSRYQNIDDLYNLISVYKTNYEYKNTVRLALVYKDTLEVIGYIGYTKRKEKTYELVYGIKSVFSKKGLVKDGILSLLEALDYDKVYAYTIDKNTRSVNLLKRLGFIYNENKNSFFENEKQKYTTLYFEKNA